MRFKLSGKKKELRYLNSEFCLFFLKFWVYVSILNWCLAIQGFFLFPPWNKKCNINKLRLFLRIVSLYLAILKLYLAVLNLNVAMLTFFSELWEKKSEFWEKYAITFFLLFCQKHASIDIRSDLYPEELFCCAASRHNVRSGGKCHGGLLQASAVVWHLNIYLD